jgi:sugar (pentulose or hexulose) kinase
MNKELGVVPGKLIVCGGGSNSDLFMQIVADVFGIAAIRNVVNGAAGLGAAISVAVATGVYQNYDEAVQHMVKPKDEFFPDEANHRTYAGINEGSFRDLTSMLEGTFKAIHTSYEH